MCIREFVELQFWNLLSLLSNRRILRNIHWKWWTHSRRPSCKWRHWNCVSTLFVVSCEKSPRPCSLLNWSSFFVVCKGEFFDDDLEVSQTWKIDYQKRFPVIPMYSMCQEAGVCRGSAWHENLESLQADWNRKTISHCNLIPRLEILLDHSKTSSVLAFPATVKWAAELSRDFLFIFSTETSAFRCVDNFSCTRTWSRRDSMYPCCASCNSFLWAQACCWSWLIQLLRDPTWCSCLISSDFVLLSKWFLLPPRKDLPQFDASAFLKPELLNWFPGSWPVYENIAAGFPDAPGSWDELDIEPFLKLAWVRFALAPLSCNEAAGFTGAVGIREDS